MQQLWNEWLQSPQTTFYFVWNIIFLWLDIYHLINYWMMNRILTNTIVVFVVRLTFETWVHERRATNGAHLALNVPTPHGNQIPAFEREHRVSVVVQRVRIVVVQQLLLLLWLQHFKFAQFVQRGRVIVAGLE